MFLNSNTGINSRNVNLSTLRMVVRSMTPTVRTPTPRAINNAMGKTTRRATRKFSSILPLLPLPAG